MDLRLDGRRVGSGRPTDAVPPAPPPEVRDPSQSGAGRCTAVELAVTRERQGVEHDERGRHEVPREAVGGRGAQDLRVEVRSCHVRHEPGTPPRVLGEHDRGLGHAVERDERLLDLARFDAEAVQRDLVVVATEQAQGAVLGAAGEVARAVQALPGTPPGRATKRLAVRPARPRYASASCGPAR